MTTTTILGLGFAHNAKGERYAAFFAQRALNRTSRAVPFDRAAFIAAQVRAEQARDTALIAAFLEAGHLHKVDGESLLYSFDHYAPDDYLVATMTVDGVPYRADFNPDLELVAVMRADQSVVWEAPYTVAETEEA